MSIPILLYRNLVYYARLHVGTLLGVAVASAVLIGSLLAGDSVRSSLRRMALDRLGKAEVALASGDRFFRSALADDLQKELKLSKLAVAIQLDGTATRGDGKARANRVQVLGVEPRFWTFARQTLLSMPKGADEIFVNRRLADQLKLVCGEELVLRVPKPSPLSREAPVAAQENASTALRLKVTGILSDAEFGRFSLQANQVPPYNIYVSLSQLQKLAGLEGQANLLLVENPAGASIDRDTAALRESWQLADGQIELRPVSSPGGLELRTSRVFLEPSVTAPLLKAFTNAAGVFTYFVNELKAGDKTTPYSMVAAVDALVPADMADDEIVIHDWLAEDLSARPGDALELRYFVVGPMRSLVEKTERFKIRSVIPIATPGVNRDLMPDFPGLAKAENCRDWDSGFPIDLAKLRPKDQKYWDDHRGTPKAFITLKAGQRLWANRFGDLTGVRFALPADAPMSKNRLEALIKQKLSPADCGLSFLPVRAQALAASEQSQDFGQLLMGFSMFLIAGALGLVSLLFQFTLEQRSIETGTLMALGFSQGRIRRLWLVEGVALAVGGIVLGAAGGIGCARAMIWALSTIWRDAVGTSSLELDISLASISLGMGIALLVCVATIWLNLRKQGRRPARELLVMGAEYSSYEAGFESRKPNKGIGWATFCFVSSMLIIGIGALKPDAATGAFFGAGALLLCAGLACCFAFFSSLAFADSDGSATLSSLGVRNCARRPTRSLATTAMLACGVFIVIAVGAFRLDTPKTWTTRQSGTGGFALIGETTLPIVNDLNRDEGRNFFGMDASNLVGVRFVPFRVHAGDEASCLNLNRAQKPRILGVDPSSLQSRNAFDFSTVVSGVSVKEPWLALNGITADGAIPAIADQASILWAMGRKVGDTILLQDEFGKDLKLKLVGSLANSLMQGNLIIAETNFIKRFPSESGYRMFLIDAPEGGVERTSEYLSKNMLDAGMELTPTPRRLAMFNAVQNTYLSAFQMLGGLGLLLGTLGLGMLVARNILERRSELALLRAVGFGRRPLMRLILGEHGALMLLGVAIGAVAAVIAVAPALASMKSAAPLASLAVLLGGVLASGSFWIWCAASMALRGQLLESLRNNG